VLDTCSDSLPNQKYAQGSQTVAAELRVVVFVDRHVLADVDIQYAGVDSSGGRISRDHSGTGDSFQVPAGSYRICVSAQVGSGRAPIEVAYIDRTFGGQSWSSDTDACVGNLYVPEAAPGATPVGQYVFEVHQPSAE
jgi:hypothetical protein